MDKINFELFKKALKHLDFDENPIKVTDLSLLFFEKLQLPLELLQFFKKYSFRNEISFANVYFGVVNKIRTENLDAINKQIFKQNLLIIGAGLNGDPIVINIENLEMGFLFHDISWGKDSFDIKEVYVNMKLSLGEFFYFALT